MPNLLSRPQFTSSTSDSISLRVDVNEQANCEGVEGLTITATIAEGTRIIPQHKRLTLLMVLSHLSPYLLVTIHALLLLRMELDL